MKGPIRRCLGALLIVVMSLQSAGCTTWHALPQLTPSTSAETQGHNIRVHLRDSTTVYAQQHRFVGDTLMVQTKDRAGAVQTQAIPTEDIARLEIEKFATARVLIITALVITGVIVAALTVDYM